MVALVIRGSLSTAEGWVQSYGGKQHGIYGEQMSPIIISLLLSIHLLPS
jgi:hypothetical protein